VLSISTTTTYFVLYSIGNDLVKKAKSNLYWNSLQTE
jgi:hypothetical protein